MPDARFDIYFSGELLPNQDMAAVRARIGDLFKVSGDALDRLFSGKPVRIKQQVEPEMARRYQKAIQKAGAFAELRLLQDPAANNVQPITNHQDDGDETANVPPPISDTIVVEAAWSLAPVGTTVDDTQPPPALQVNISELSVLPAESGSLADCVVDKPPVAIPDISGLQLEDD